MANTKAKKRSIRKDEERRQNNVAVKSRMKTEIKKAEAAIETKDGNAIKPALSSAISTIDRAAAKGVIHKNSAARMKSQLQQRAASL